MSATGKLRSVVAWVGAFLLGIWDTELYVAEGTVVVDGRRIPVSRSVTVGKVAVALLIFSIGIWLARRTYAAAKRRGTRWFKEEVQIQIVSVALAILVAVFSLCVAMATVRIPWSVFAFAGGALAIGVGFGARNLFNNLISGIIIMIEQPIRVGDIVEVTGGRGRVEEISNRCVRVRRSDGIDVLIPNSFFLEQPVVNWTHSDADIRGEVVVGVAYGSPVKQVRELLLQAANEHEKIRRDPEPIVLYEEFGDNSLNFRLLFWTPVSRPMDLRILCSDLHYRIDELFRAANITIAFPQRDVHLETLKPLEVRLARE